MTKKLLLPAALVMLLSVVAKADLVEEGQIARQFKIVNVSSFKGYTFSFLYQTYHYDHGYQPNAPQRVICDDTTIYEASTRWDATYLEAVDAKGNKFRTKEQIGGEDRVTDKNIYAIVDVYKVDSLKDGIIILKKIEEIYMNREGPDRHRKMDALMTSGTSGGSGIFPFLIGGAVFALLGLIIFFFIRKKRRAASNTLSVG